MITIADWRLANARSIDAAIAAEAARWRRAFHWDVEDAWRSIQPARAAGTLPGFVAHDAAGNLAGWTCFMPHHGTLQVAVLTAAAPATTTALVDAILTAPEMSAAQACSICVPDGPPLVAGTLVSRGFEVVPYAYMTLELGGLPRRALESATASDAVRGSLDPIAARAFRAGDFPALVALLSRAYPDPHDVRAFAPLGSHQEWSDYASNLVSGPGCGTLVLDASVVVEGAERDRLDAAVLATDLGLGTGHIAQIAVDPARQRLGLGTGLIRQCIGVFAKKGFERVTLLVSAANARAQAVYSRFGFRERGAFVVAVNRTPHLRARRSGFSRGD
jgi:ribosomal protein S18 acetylase RimI-like enzyme